MSAHYQHYKLTCFHLNLNYNGGSRNDYIDECFWKVTVIKLFHLIKELY